MGGVCWEWLGEGDERWADQKEWDAWKEQRLRHEWKVSKGRRSGRDRGREGMLSIFGHLNPVGALTSEEDRSELCGSDTHEMHAGANAGSGCLSNKRTQWRRRRDKKGKTREVE